ncbi:SMI1/KNR4 family protein [Kitasatospora nipponensis]|uniref:SMI1/KNR4 family protein n=1 Tax=Kitasatospora nipponensis TaxID=258049 RepID=UPI0031D5AFBC
MVFEVLGRAQELRTPPGAWSQAEGTAGTELPDDLKAITVAYAPVCLNHHLTLYHPSTSAFNLADHLKGELEQLNALDWFAEEGPAYHGSAPRFGGPHGLLPIAVTDRRESLFIRRTESGEWICVTLSAFGGAFREFPMGFAEWLYRYLEGEEMFGPGTDVYYPGPVRIEELPQYRGDDVRDRWGPPRAPKQA